MAWFKTYEDALAEVKREQTASSGKVSLAIVRDHRNNQLRVVSWKQARTWEIIPAETRRFWIEQEFLADSENLTHVFGEFDESIPAATPSDPSETAPRTL